MAGEDLNDPPLQQSNASSTQDSEGSAAVVLHIEVLDSRILNAVSASREISISDLESPRVHK
jgi:hypothetical protein